MAKRPFNGSPTVDGYYTTFDSSEVHRVDNSGGDTPSGSSDFSTAIVTIVNNDSLKFSSELVHIGEGTPFSEPSLETSIAVARSSTSVIEAVLYRGVTLMDTKGRDISVSGDASMGPVTVTITGDCTITVNQGEG